MSSISLANVIPFSFLADWSEAVVERLEWYTDVIQAYRGQEQRRSLRLAPRQTFEFSVCANDATRQHLEAILWGRGAAYFAVPLWFDGMPLDASLSSGATSIPLSSALRQFAVGDFVLFLGANSASVEVVSVASVGGSIGITATVNTWPAGTMIYPARAARLSNDLSLPRFTGQVSSARLRFEMMDPADYTADAGATTYRSLPVFEESADWSAEPELSIERKLSVFDAATGPLVIDDLAEIPLPSFRSRYTLEDKAACDIWRKRLYALRGKQGAIWVPSLADDLTVVASIGSGDTTIDVRWAGYTDYLFGDPNRKDIRIQLANGTVLYRRVTASSEISTTAERLTIDAALGVAVAVSEVVLVSWLTLMRAESDAAEFAYWTGDVVDTTANFRGFRHEL